LRAMTDTPEDDYNTNKPRSWLERLTALLTGEPKNREQLMDVLKDAEEHGIVNAEMLNMIQSILQVSETRVHEIMVPKKDMIVIKQGSSLEKLLPVIIESGHSRLPIIDASGKNIVGMLLAKDLLKFFYDCKEEKFKIEDFVRPAIFIPQTKRLDTLLREFRVNHNHIAIVLDEYGHVAGLVTMEDVLEEIVGEIEDEYDVDE